MSLSIEASIRKLLTEDKVCMGRVTGATVRMLALQFAREPEPDGDVLAERAVCVAILGHVRDRLDKLAMDGGPMGLIIEARRVAEAIHFIELGLHRDSKQGGKS